MIFKITMKYWTMFLKLMCEPLVYFLFLKENPFLVQLNNQLDKYVDH